MWKQKGNATSYEEFLKQNTGMNIEEFIDVYKEYKINGLEEIKKALLYAAENNIFVSVIGDYDVDGIDALLIMAYILRALGIEFALITPKRISEGYGISEAIVDRIKEGIIITVDNGISAIEPIKKAKEKGLDVYIMDHHIAGEELPPANVIVDPSAFPNTSDFKDYCGAGLAFKLAELIFGYDHPLIKTLSGFAAIGTIGDSVPLYGDNRRIVQQGLIYIKSGYCTKGLQELLLKCNMNQYSTAEDYAYYLAPCINAPGRLYDDGAKLSVQALWCNNEKAEEYANNLFEINQKRKDIVKEILDSIDMEQLKYDKSKFVFYYNPTLPEGLAGLLAGRFLEETSKISIVLVKTEDGKIKGSCRSKNDNIHLKKILDECSDLLLSYGGHQKAGAVKLEEQNLEALKERLEKLLPEVIVDENLYYDLKIQAKDVVHLTDLLESMEPFGEGNPAPIVCLENIRLGNNFGNKISFMESKSKTDEESQPEHVRFYFKSFNAVGFHLAEKCKRLITDEKQEIFLNLLGKLEKNYYKGKVYYQIRLIDFEKCK